MYIINGTKSNPFYKAIAKLADEAIGFKDQSAMITPIETDLSKPIRFKDQSVYTTLVGTDLSSGKPMLFEVEFTFHDGKRFVGICFNSSNEVHSLARFDVDLTDTSYLLGFLYKISTSIRTGQVEGSFIPDTLSGEIDNSKVATINGFENGIIIDIVKK